MRRKFTAKLADRRRKQVCASEACRCLQGAQPGAHVKSKGSPSSGTARARPEPGHQLPVNLFARMLALWPPKPNELFRTASTFIWRAVLGT